MRPVLSFWTQSAVSSRPRNRSTTSRMFSRSTTWSCRTGLASSPAIPGGTSRPRSSEISENSSLEDFSLPDPGHQAEECARDGDLIHGPDDFPVLDEKAARQQREIARYGVHARVSTRHFGDDQTVSKRFDELIERCRAWDHIQVAGGDAHRRTGRGASSV